MQIHNGGYNQLVLEIGVPISAVGDTAPATDTGGPELIQQIHALVGDAGAAVVLFKDSVENSHVSTCPCKAIYYDGGLIGYAFYTFQSTDAAPFGALEIDVTIDNGAVRVEGSYREIVAAG